MRDWALLAAAAQAAGPETVAALARVMRAAGIDGLPDAPAAAPEPALEPTPEPASGPASEPLQALEPWMPGGESRGDDFDFSPLDGDADTEGTAHWELVAPLADLTRAIRDSGLDLNAIRPLASGTVAAVSAGERGEAKLIHPSPFCADPRQFLKVVAILVKAVPTLRLYRVRSHAGREAETVLVRVFPQPGRETLDLLEAYHPAAAADVEAMAANVARVFAHFAGKV